MSNNLGGFSYGVYLLRERLSLSSQQERKKMDFKFPLSVSCILFITSAISSFLFVLNYITLKVAIAVTCSWLIFRNPITFMNGDDSSSW